MRCCHDESAATKCELNTTSCPLANVIATSHHVKYLHDVVFHRYVDF